MMFNKTPALTICFTLIYPLANTIAFGGVAIGNINAQLDAIVTGIKTYNSGTPKPIAIPAITGAKTATNATLLINSVMNNIKNYQ